MPLSWKTMGRALSFSNFELRAWKGLGRHSYGAGSSLSIAYEDLLNRLFCLF